MERSEKISEFLAERIMVGDFPSAVYLVAEKGEIMFGDALGFSMKEPMQIEAKFDTIYDLASLTKVLVTGLLCAKLIEDEQIDLSDPLAKYFPQFDVPDKAAITLQRVLSHTSGFAAWKPFYLLTGLDISAECKDKKNKIIELIAKEPLNYETGTKVVYSDLNFLMLGFLIEQIHDKRLDAVAKKEIFETLRLYATIFNPIAVNPPAEVAASERGNNYEKETCKESGYDVSGYQWREGFIWMQVHDGNAHYLNGVAGHAGIFSSIEETFTIAQQFLPVSKILKPETCEMFRTNFTVGLNEARSAGFELAATEGSTAGDALAKDSFGHLGFTGTSLWIEPRSERVFILLTNRTHARDLPFVNINSVRREFHRLAAEELDR